MLLKNVFGFYLQSSFHVALSVISLTLMTMLHFNLAVDVDLLVFVFLSVILGYNYIKYAYVVRLHYRSLTRSLKLIQIFSFFCFAGLIYYVLQMPLEVLLITLLFGCVTLFYGLPLFRQRNLRSVGGIKIFVIALVWAGVTVILPVVNYEGLVNQDVTIEFFQRLLFVLVLILPFEIRDLRYDPDQLRTVPQILGVKKTKFVGIGLLVIWLLSEFLQSELRPEIILSMFFTAVLLAVLLFRTKGRQSKYHTAFFVEAIPVFWLIVSLVLKNFF